MNLRTLEHSLIDANVSKVSVLLSSTLSLLPYLFLLLRYLAAGSVKIQTMML